MDQQRTSQPWNIAYHSVLLSASDLLAFCERTPSAHEAVVYPQMLVLLLF